jgi:hypothetical protein
MLCHISLHKALPGYSVLTRAIPHALAAQVLHSLTTDSRLYCSADGLLTRAQDLLSQTGNHCLLDCPEKLRVKSYFATGDLPPISSSWRQASSDSQPEFSFASDTYGHSPYVTSSVTRGWGCLLWIFLAFVKGTYRTCSMLLNILPFAQYISPLSVHALQSRSCLFYFPSVGRLNCYWPSPAQSFLASVSSGSMTKIFYLYSPLDMYVFRNGASSSTRDGSIFLCRRYVYCTVVSAWEYPRCHGVQVTVESVNPLSLN